MSNVKMCKNVKLSRINNLNPKPKQFKIQKDCYIKEKYRFAKVQYLQSLDLQIENSTLLLNSHL